MDYSTPSLDFRGTGDIAIWGLLKDDEDDAEMERMTDLLQDLLTRRGRFGIRSDFTDSLDGYSSGGYRTLYITGHSRFMEAEGGIRPLMSRKIGGFGLDKVITELYRAINSGVTYVEFWCCESGCKRGSKTLVGDSNGMITTTLTWRDIDLLNMRCDKSAWSEISTLEYICAKLFECAIREKNVYMAAVEITALNGVGYVTQDDSYITTFDQAAGLTNYNGILEYEKQIRSGREGQHTKKNLRQAESRLRTHIQTRTCHFICCTINVGNIMKEYSQISAYSRQDAKARKQSLADPGRIDQETKDGMGELLNDMLKR